MKASSLILLTMKALQRPTAIPARIVITQVTMNGTPMPTRVAARTPEKAASDPGDRSFCPAMMR